MFLEKIEICSLTELRWSSQVTTSFITAMFHWVSLGGVWKLRVEVGGVEVGDFLGLRRVCFFRDFRSRFMRGFGKTEVGDLA